MIKPLLLISIAAIILHPVIAQVSIGTKTPSSSSVFDLSSTSKGLLIPRMSTAQRNAIVNPAAGLLVFDLDKSTIYFFDGNRWQAMLFTNSTAINPPVGRAAADGMPADKFGQSVSISGDYAIIGTPNDDIGAKTDQGSAYIFTRKDGGWAMQAKLTAADGAAGDFFGNSVSISGNYAVVGAYKAGGNYFLEGAAYVFMRNGNNWLQVAKLNATDAVPGDFFGTSVGIDGDNIVIGSPSARVTYASQGAVYVFVRNGTAWSQQAKLTVSFGEYNEQMGFSVAIDGNSVIAGAPYRDYNGYPTDVGIAYVFVKSGSSWSFQDGFSNSGGYNSYNFGYSVSISGDYAAVGEPWGYNNPNAGSGAVYIFKRVGIHWGLETRLHAPDQQADAIFGISTCINADNLIIGSSAYSVGFNSYQGVAYMYHQSGTSWIPIRRIDDGSGQAGGLFGISVGVSGFNYIIGAAGKNGYKGEVSFLNNE